MKSLFLHKVTVFIATMRISLSISECRIYMAPSSLGGASFGIYTTSPIEEGEQLLKGDDGPNIAVVDPFQDDSIERLQWTQLFDNYWWGRGVADQVSYEAKTVLDFQDTFGSLPNHHCILDSISHRAPEVPYIDSTDPGDPSAGAFSYHTCRQFYATRNIQAGEELFLNYGHCSEEGSDSYNTPEWTSNIPKTDDYSLATAFSIYLLSVHLAKPLSIDEYKELIRTTEVYQGQHVSDRVRSLLPVSIDELLRVVTVDPELPLDHKLARFVGKTILSPQWIQQNGFCLENLKPGTSQITGAGQGAFSQNVIEKGEIVVPVPLLHVVDREAFRLPDDTYQLLLNYCFGHDQSSLLLCPLTNAVLINHCSARKKQCGPEGPNAIVRWSSGWEPRQNEFTNMTLTELSQAQGHGLALEVVATRRIVAGEEVFIDYGADWERAWEHHLSTWHESPSSNYVSIQRMNGESMVPTVAGDLQEAEDSTFFTGCVYWSSADDNDPVYHEEAPDWHEMSDEEILEEYSTDGSIFVGNYETHAGNTYWPCSVQHQDNEEDEEESYVVRIHQAPFSSTMPWAENGVPRLLTKFPRSSIHFFRKPYKSAQHSPNAFRHAIGIPNHIFPPQWKNLSREQSS